MNFASLPSFCTMTYHLLDLSPTSANRHIPLKCHTMQTAPSYAATMNSPVTWQSHTENAACFNNWWHVRIWAGLLWPRPYVHWVHSSPLSKGNSIGVICCWVLCLKSIVRESCNFEWKEEEWSTFWPFGDFLVQCFHNVWISCLAQWANQAVWELYLLLFQAKVFLNCQNSIILCFVCIPYTISSLVRPISGTLSLNCTL